MILTTLVAASRKCYRCTIFTLVINLLSLVRGNSQCTKYVVDGILPIFTEPSFSFATRIVSSKVCRLLFCVNYNKNLNYVTEKHRTFKTARHGGVTISTVSFIQFLDMTLSLAISGGIFTLRNSSTNAAEDILFST